MLFALSHPHSLIARRQRGDQRLGKPHIVAHERSNSGTSWFSSAVGFPWRLPADSRAMRSPVTLAN